MMKVLSEEKYTKLMRRIQKDIALNIDVCLEFLKDIKELGKESGDRNKQIEEDIADIIRR